MRLIFQNEATEEEIQAAKKPVKPAGKAKANPKRAAAKGSAVPPVERPPPPTPDSTKKLSPNPAPTKRLKGKQGQTKDAEETIKELQEAVIIPKSKSLSMFLCYMHFFAISTVYLEVCLLIGT